MSHKYETLLEMLKGPITIEAVGPVKWAWVNRDPVSPTIVSYWLEHDLIIEVKPGLWIKRSEFVEPKKCPTCGQVVTKT